MRFLVLAGSLRPDSLNRRFGRHLAQRLEALGHAVEVFDGEALRLPLYEDSLPVPEALARLHRALQGAAGLVLVSPEYNAGIPAHLKNAVDWLSTLSPSPWPDLPVLLCACSPGALGGARGLLAWRPTLANLGALALPQVITVPGADQTLDAQGAPLDPRSAEATTRALDALIHLAGRLRGPSLQ